MIRINQNLKEVKYIKLHVQECNTIALKFYEKHGFTNVTKIDNYYTDIEPKAAYYLNLKLHDWVKL